jgi:chromosomal replication initiation ATPase DnaA|tara:strand:+ start:213 stop:674 length:462 start_codon:yes stop_codon:yes gene_type:complete
MNETEELLVEKMVDEYRIKLKAMVRVSEDTQDIKMFKPYNTIIDEFSKIHYEHFYDKNNQRVKTDVQLYSDRLGIPLIHLVSKSRKGDLRMVRNVIWYVIIGELKACDASYKLIGDIFNRDRGTIRASYKKTFDSVSVGDKLILSMVDSLKSE